MDLARNNPSSVVHVAALASVFQTNRFWSSLAAIFTCFAICQAPAVQKMDNAIHRINHYPVHDKYWENQLHYPADREFIR